MDQEAPLYNLRIMWWFLKLTLVERLSNMETALLPLKCQKMPAQMMQQSHCIRMVEKFFLNRRKSQGNLYTITPKGNAESFESTPNPKSKILEAQLTKGYILSYLFYDKGTIKYDGLPKAGRLAEDLNDQTLFFTHSTGKSIISYIIGPRYM